MSAPLAGLGLQGAQVRALRGDEGMSGGLMPWLQSPPDAAAGTPDAAPSGTHVWGKTPGQLADAQRLQAYLLKKQNEVAPAAAAGVQTDYVPSWVTSGEGGMG
jgi:hypothetical protein